MLLKSNISCSAVIIFHFTSSIIPYTIVIYHDLRHAARFTFVISHVTQNFQPGQLLVNLSWRNFRYLYHRFCCFFQPKWKLIWINSFVLSVSQHFSISPPAFVQCFEETQQNTLDLDFDIFRELTDRIVIIENTSHVTLRQIPIYGSNNILRETLLALTYVIEINCVMCS